MPDDTFVVNVLFSELTNFKETERDDDFQNDSVLQTIRWPIVNGCVMASAVVEQDLPFHHLKHEKYSWLRLNGLRGSVIVIYDFIREKVLALGREEN